MTRRDLAGAKVFVIDDFLTAEECAAQIARAESTGFDDAPINTGGSFVVMKEVRNNTRVMLDDPATAVVLWAKLQPCLPASVGQWSVGHWEPVGVNERFRWYRYDPGQRFAPHLDGHFQRENGECSRLTFMVYLNDGFEGGATIFHEYDPEIVVQPVRGMALLFTHRQLHEGAPILKGRKYVLRSDVMCHYRAVEEQQQPPEEEDDTVRLFERIKRGK